MFISDCVCRVIYSLCMTCAFPFVVFPVVGFGGFCGFFFSFCVFFCVFFLLRFFFFHFIEFFGRPDVCAKFGEFLSVFSGSNLAILTP